MTEDTFRKLALSLPDAIEVGHMGHPDFRVSGKIFATLGYPAAGWAMVKLTIDQQEAFIAELPGTFVPVKGKWGQQGATNVVLRGAAREAVKRALSVAWSNQASKSLLERFPQP